jgi:hypothetical protein
MAIGKGLCGPLLKGQTGVRSRGISYTLGQLQKSKGKNQIPSLRSLFGLKEGCEGSIENDDQLYANSSKETVDQPTEQDDPTRPAKLGMLLSQIFNPKPGAAESLTRMHREMELMRNLSPLEEKRRPVETGTFGMNMMRAFCVVCT